MQAIVADLETARYITRTRADDGRRNRYAPVPGAAFRHPAEAGHEIVGLLKLLAEPAASPSAATP